MQSAAAIYFAALIIIRVRALGCNFHPHRDAFALCCEMLGVLCSTVLYTPFCAHYHINTYTLYTPPARPLPCRKCVYVPNICLSNAMHKNATITSTADCTTPQHRCCAVYWTRASSHERACILYPRARRVTAKEPRARRLNMPTNSRVRAQFEQQRKFRATMYYTLLLA